MNWLMFFATLFILLGGIFSISSTSIAIECYNKNKEHKEKNPSNFSFLIFNLIVAIIVVLITIILLYFVTFRNFGSSAQTITFKYQPQPLQAQPPQPLQAQPPSYQQAQQTGGKWKMKRLGKK
jgi:hypothetical protein